MDRNATSAEIVIRPAPLDGIDRTPLPERLRAHARAIPDAPALIAGDAVTSWSQLVRDMDWTAGWLGAQGIGRGDVVASVAGRLAAARDALHGGAGRGGLHGATARSPPIPRRSPR